MKRELLICGLVGGVLIAVLRWTEYRFLVVEHSLQIYGGLTAALFAALGIWLGVRLSRSGSPPASEPAPGESVPAAAPFISDEQRRLELGITPREMEVLALIARGLSNREIAETLHVSENTVKTHSSRVFDKLGAQRRTQAVQMGKELGLLG